MPATSTPAPLLYEGVADRIQALVARGALRPGARLPSVRAMSAREGVSVATVVHAYTLLESRGVIEARPQSGHYVRRPALAESPEPRAPRATRTASRVTIDEQVASIYRTLADPSIVPLGIAIPSPDLLPYQRLAALLGRVAREGGGRAADYERPEGNLSLRRQIARRAADAGVAVRPEDVIVTVGAMEALHLSLRATTKPGDTVAVEAPTYYGIWRMLASLGLRAVEIPVHPSTGLDLAALEAALGAHPIRACLVTPNFNNPTGARMSDDAKAELVRLLARRDVPLVEDDIYGELAFDGTRHKPAKAWDTRGQVLLCASFSKTLAPGYRIGWVMPGAYHDRVEALKFAQSIATPTVTQLAVAAFLEDGGYARHLRRLRTALADQVRAATECITETFPPGTRVSRPNGGLVLWIELPPRVSGLALHEAALARRISVAPGPLFSSTSSRFGGFLRVSCGAPIVGETARAIRTLGALATELSRS